MTLEMSETFDPYHRWLGIPPAEQPPHHYRLLGLGLFESDPDVIEQAADRQMAHFQTHRTGPHSAVSQNLLNELASAKLCLLQPANKAAYDQGLKEKVLAPPRPRSAPIPVARPVDMAPPVESARIEIKTPATVARGGSARPSGYHRLAVGGLIGATLLAALAVWLLNGGDRPNRAKTAGSQSPAPRTADVKTKRTQNSAPRATVPAPPAPVASGSRPLDLITQIAPVRDLRRRSRA